MRANLRHRSKGQSRARENLARYPRCCWSGGDAVSSAATAAAASLDIFEPQQGDVILGRSDWHCSPKAADELLRIVAGSFGPVFDVAAGIHRRLSVLGGDDDQRRIDQMPCRQLGDHLSNRTYRRIRFLFQRGAGRPDRIDIAAGLAVSRRHRAMLVNQLLPMLTAWKFIPKMVGTGAFAVPS